MNLLPEKIFFFDVDGVLIQHANPGKSYWADTVYEDCGIHHASLQDFFAKEFEACLEGRADLKMVLKPWIAKWKYNGTVDDFIDYWFRSDATIDNDVLQKAIQLGQTFPCYLATNQERYRAEYLMTTLGFQNHFRAIFAACEFGCAKPKLDFFLSVQSKIRLEYNFDFKPSQFYFVDDSDRNVKAAAQLGWNAHHFTNYKAFETWTRS